MCCMYRHCLRRRWRWWLRRCLTSLRTMFSRMRLGSKSTLSQIERIEDQAGSDRKNSMSIRAVIVDLGGVLLNIPDIKNRYTKWEMRFQLQPGELHLILRQEGFFADADAGRFSEQGMVFRLGTILDLNEEQALEFLRDLEAQKELNHDMAAFLSNAWPGARKQYARYQFEELADTVIYSCEEGIAKPEPAIYHLAYQRLGVTPEEAVFLDDVEDFVEGARRVGMRAVLFQHTAQAIADIHAYLDDPLGI